MTISLYLNLLLRFLVIKINKFVFYSIPPSPHTFVSLSLVSSQFSFLTSVSNLICLKNNKSVRYYSEVLTFKPHSPLTPSTVSLFNNGSLTPTHVELAKSIFISLAESETYIIKTKPSHLSPDKWLELDTFTKKELSIRKDILKKHGKQVIGSMSGTEMAIRELFHYVFTYMSKKYPQCYCLHILLGKTYIIKNKLTNKDYFIPNLFLHDPVELLRILSVCVPVDFNILVKVEGKYFLKASNSLYSIN